MTQYKLAIIMLTHEQPECVEDNVPIKKPRHSAVGGIRPI